MFRKPLTRESFFRAHFGIGVGALFIAQSVPIEVVAIIAFVTAAVMTFPMNIILLLVATFLEDLLNDYALGRTHIFILVSLALSALLLNSWLWSFILLRKSSPQAPEAPSPPDPES